MVPDYTSSIDLDTEILRELEEDQPTQHEDPGKSIHFFCKRKEKIQKERLFFFPFLLFLINELPSLVYLFQEIFKKKSSLN